MIVVVGDNMLDRDVHYRATGRLSPETGKPIVELIGVEERPGGAGAVCEMVKGLGEDAALLCHRSASLKERHKIDSVEVFRRDADCAEALDEEFADEFVRRIKNCPPRLLLCADYGKGTITPYLWGQLAATRIPLIVDPARGRSFEFYQGAHAICPNRLEWEQVTGLDSHRGQVATWNPHVYDFESICLKLDRDGMQVYRGGESIHLPAVSSHVRDTCGAGDMVLAALGVGLVRGLSWLDACRFANRCAAAKCRKVGAVPVSLGEVDSQPDTDTVFSPPARAQFPRG